MRHAAACLAGHFVICGLAVAAAQDLPYPGDPAQADAGGYVALRGSLTFDGKGAAVSVPAGSGPVALRPSHAIGGGGAVAVGATLPYGFRVELEGLYRNRPVKSVDVGGTAVPGGGYIQTAAPMANLIWAPKFDGMPIRPMIGGGVGMAYDQSRVNDWAGGNIYLRNAGWHFAYQGMAGLDVPVAPGASITAQYRWMHTDNVTARCGTGGAPTLTCRKIGFDDQGVDLGLKLDLP